MGSKIINLEIFLIYFFLLIPWPHTNVIRRLCSKDNSRLVRRIVRSKWTPILDKYQVKLPMECPLHPFRDIFAPRQDAKKRDRPTQWTCRLCGKSFYQEKFLDLHFETRHKTVINDAEDAVCLADYCDIMRCEVFQTEESSSLKIGDQTIVTDIEVWGDSFGQNSALAKANVAYLSLLPIRTSSIGASRAAKVQNRQLCQDKIGQTKCQQTEPSNENYIYNNNNNGASRAKFATHSQPTAESLTSSAAAPANIYSSSSSSASSSSSSARSNHPKSSSSSTSSASSSSSSSSSYGSAASAAMPIPNGASSSDSSSTGSSSSSNSASSTSSSASMAKEQKSRYDSRTDQNSRASSHDPQESGNDSVKTQGNTSENDDSNKTSAANGQLTNMQKIRANCKTEELSKLRARCEYLVRSCIGGLILSMTDQQFKDMEEEMNRAVCWYLTCERYWEDGPLEPRAFPWGLIIILVFVLSSGVCFCYYIIWILFDSEETTINATATNHHYYPHEEHYLHQQEIPAQYRQHQHLYIPASHHHQQQQQQQQQQQHFLHHQPHMEDHYHFQEYPTTGMHQQQQQQQHHHHGMNSGDHPTNSQYYQYQQQRELESTHPHDIYPEPVQYDYRHSPRRYIGDPRRPGTPTITMSSGVIGSVAGGGQTPLRHPPTQNLAYQQDILDRRDYISSRPLATTAVSSHSHNTLASTRGPNTGSSGALSSLSHHSAQLDCDNTLPATHLGSSGSASGGIGVGHGGSGGIKHYNTIPRPLETRQRYVSGSQQSLRGSSSTHEIIQNEVGHNEHYIYVTYPPDLKKRFFEKYE